MSYKLSFMRLLILWGFLVITYFHLSAQSDFQPGYIITNSLDTVHGLVDYRGEIRNMRVCTFKESTLDEPKEYFPRDIYGYRFNTSKFYVSKEIKTQELNDTVFVEILLKGIYNLYYYNSLNYSSYFIESEDKELLELSIDKIAFDKDGKPIYKQYKKYLGMLSYAFADYPEMRKDIANVDLSHKSLIQITRKYHDYKCSDEACVIYEKKLPVFRIELKPMIGYSLSVINFRNSALEKVDFQMSSSPFAGVGMNLIVPRWNEKITFLMNLAFNKDYFYGTSFFQHDFSHAINSYYHIYNSNFISSFSLKYTYPKGKFRPDVYLGVFGNAIIKSDVKFYSEVVSNNHVYTSVENLEIFSKWNRGLTSGVGLEYQFFNKLKAFTNFSLLYGEDNPNYKMETSFISYRLSTGLTF